MLRFCDRRRACGACATLRACLLRDGACPLLALFGILATAFPLAVPAPPQPATARAQPAQTALDRYVAAPDPNFTWKVVRELPAEGVTATLVEMTSQQWLTDKGRSYGIYVVIATQLALNVIFTWGCWRLLQRTAPAAGGETFRSIVTLFFFWAGLGMALYLLTDFLASFLFGVFLYGFIFCRGRYSVFLSGTSLALATLTRPTFTFIPFLLPFAAYLIGQFSEKIPRKHLVVFIVCSFIATGISIMYQCSADGYIGPSSIVTQNIERAIYFSLKENHITESSYIEEFKRVMERRAGQSFVSISRRAIKRNMLRKCFLKC